MTQQPRPTPFAPALTVAAALEHYLTENGFSTSEYTAPTFDVTFGPFAMTLPNTPDRQRAIALHDLHHVATGYGTDLVGEAEVAVFELRAGCTTPFLWAINLAGLATGWFLAPHRMWRAWRNARGARSLYKQGVTAEDAKALTVGELRARVGLPAHGVAEGPRRLHARAPVPHAA